MLNGKAVYVNPNLIELLERTPDTMLTLTTGKRLIVRESPEEVARLFTEYISKVAKSPFGVREVVSWT
jgi:flagellar protein FlbD